MCGAGTGCDRSHYLGWLCGNTVLLPYSLLQVMRKLKLLPLSGEPIDVAISRFQYLGDEVSVHPIHQQTAYLLATLHTESLLPDLHSCQIYKYSV